VVNKKMRLSAMERQDLQSLSEGVRFLSDVLAVIKIIDKLKHSLQNALVL